MKRVTGWMLLAWCVCVVGGCVAQPLPTYPAMSDAESLATIAARLESVTTVSATADIVLTNSDGETVSLDGAFVAALPDRARLRAWKFGTAVLDLTITVDGVWAIVPEREGGGEASHMSASGVARALELASGAYFRQAHAMAEESTASVLVVRGKAMGVDEIRCEIDRATLTPRRYTLTNGSGESRRTMTLVVDRYALIGGGSHQGTGVAWARRVTFTSPQGEIVLRLHDVELNGGVEPAALATPARAVKLR